VMASSSEAMRVLELFELQSQEGPCLDCYRTGQPVVNQVLTLPNSWPQFTVEALAAGFRSVHAFPMRLRGTVIGALNLFHLEPGEMGHADVEAAQALADVATIGILQHRAAREAQILNEQLNGALNSRVVIEQAKGMVAEHEGLNMDEAFSLLRSHARNRNLRLADVARDVISGTLTASELERAPATKPF
jgi:GAF domain-containing protein